MEEEERKEKRTKTEEEQKEEIDCSSLQGKIIVGVDPGKRSILHITTDDKCKSKDGSLKYTSQQRVFESGLYKFRNKLENRKPDEIEELEHRMCSSNSRTVRLDRFLEYRSNKIFG